jgi:hypothetical protein
MKSTTFFRPHNSWSLALSLLVLATPAFSDWQTNHAESYLQKRFLCQQQLDELAWQEQNWPQQNPGAKPAFSEKYADDLSETKTHRLFAQEWLLEQNGTVIKASDLQNELNRVVQQSKAPNQLARMLSALGNDPQTIGECLIRPLLVEQHWYQLQQRAVNPKTLDLEAKDIPVNAYHHLLYSLSTSLQLPAEINNLEGLTSNSWTPIASGNPGRRNHSSVWTGTQMIVWAGFAGNSVGSSSYSNTGARWTAATDSWQSITTLDAPSERQDTPAIWTGSLMMVWGGNRLSTRYNTGGTYDPISNTWFATPMTNVPDARYSHTMIWTGTEAIVWGGKNSSSINVNSGGRYVPGSTSWTATNTTGAPSGRLLHTAVWSGTEMIIWGGGISSINLFNTGGRYNPSSDSWTATSTVNTPTTREYHTAVFGNGEMIIWGGYSGGGNTNTGARYNPGTDSWLATTLTAAPAPRRFHKSIWAQNGMIVWGDAGNTGGMYFPAQDAWVATSTTNAPDGRNFHTQLWTGSQMLIWSGSNLQTGALLTPPGPPSNLTLGGNLSGLTGDQVILQNNGGNDLVLNANGDFTFAGNVDDNDSYEVTVLTQPTSPDQTCTVSNGSGTVNGNNITNIMINCNTAPTVTNDAYTGTEDVTLTDNVFSNDTDPEMDQLNIMNPGTFTAGGIGGELTLLADGSLSYVPPVDTFGTATHDFVVTDGLNTVNSNLTIEVEAVNDPPSFTVPDFIDGFDFVNAQNSEWQIPQFVQDVVLGPDNESGQSVLQYHTVITDPDGVLNNLSIDALGQLTADFTLNPGFATVSVSLQDDGGTLNGGSDTSVVTEFTVAYEILVFTGTFESVENVIAHISKINKQQPGPNHPIIIYQGQAIGFYGEVLWLDPMTSTEELPSMIDTWLVQVMLQYDESGDFDGDGLTNSNDPSPLYQ